MSKENYIKLLQFVRKDWTGLRGRNANNKTWSSDNSDLPSLTDREIVDLFLIEQPERKEVDNPIPQQQGYSEEQLQKAMVYASQITNNKMRYIEQYIQSLKPEQSEQPDTVTEGDEFVDHDDEWYEAIFNSEWGKYNEEYNEILLSTKFQRSMISAMKKAVDKSTQALREENAKLHKQLQDSLLLYQNMANNIDQLRAENERLKKSNKE